MNKNFARTAAAASNAHLGMSGHIQSRSPLSADSTQTIRALTQSELDDLNQPRWYVLQLALSDQPINLDMLPRLEVFESHRLYAISGQQQGRCRHALRLGFFDELSAAHAIGLQLRSLFASCAVVRVSVAEHARFTKSFKPVRQSPASVTPLSHSVRPVQRTTQPVAQPTKFEAPVTPQSSSGPSVARTVVPSTRQRSVRVAAPLDSKAASPKKSSTAATRKTDKPKSLAEELMEEARQMQLAKSAKHRAPPSRQSWLARLSGLSKA